ncbi:MAG: hypothetical protein VZS44_04555 [Bacilli bacterium]|nr:hypothetical protein [Bacilli bacterium]
MKCQHCGKELPKDEKHCKYCQETYSITEISEKAKKRLTNIKMDTIITYNPNKNNSINKKKTINRILIIIVVIALLVLIPIIVYYLATSSNEEVSKESLIIATLIVTVLTIIPVTDAMKYIPIKEIDEYEGLFFIITTDNILIRLKVYGYNQEKVRKLKDEQDLKHVLNEIILKEIDPERFNKDNYIYYDTISEMAIESIVEINKVNNIQEDKEKYIINYDSMNMITELKDEKRDLIIEDVYSNTELLINTLNKLKTQP